MSSWRRSSRDEADAARSTPHRARGRARGGSSGRGPPAQQRAGGHCRAPSTGRPRSIPAELLPTGGDDRNEVPSPARCAHASIDSLLHLPATRRHRRERVPLLRVTAGARRPPARAHARGLAHGLLTVLGPGPERLAVGERRGRARAPRKGARQARKGDRSAANAGRRLRGPSPACRLGLGQAPQSVQLRARGSALQLPVKGRRSQGVTAPSARAKGASSTRLAAEPDQGNACSNLSQSRSDSSNNSWPSWLLGPNFRATSRCCAGHRISPDGVSHGYSRQGPSPASAGWLASSRSTNGARRCRTVPMARPSCSQARLLRPS